MVKYYFSKAAEVTSRLFKRVNTEPVTFFLCIFFAIIRRPKKNKKIYTCVILLCLGWDVRFSLIQWNQISQKRKFLEIILVFQYHSRHRFPNSLAEHLVRQQGKNIDVSIWSIKPPLFFLWLMYPLPSVSFSHLAVLFTDFSFSASGLHEYIASSHARASLQHALHRRVHFTG